MLLTTDAGRSWQTPSATGLPTSAGIYDLDSANGRDVVALDGLVSSASDIWLVAYLSHDGGETWEIARFAK